MELFSDKGKCCGCTACASACPKNAIVMKNDASGFVYPEINQELCVECGMCKRVCAFSTELIDSVSDKAPRVYAVVNKDTAVYKKSSSGGFFTALANEAINQNGVVYGAVFDKDFKVKHIRGTKQVDIEAMRGSKYVQSNLDGVFESVKNDLKASKLVMFVGTGCQVGGLKKYLNKDYDNLVTVDIVCHGVPSQKLFDDYKETLEKKYKAKVKSFSFRAKKLKGQIQDIEAVFDNGKVYSEYPDIDAYRNMFAKSFTLRPSCFECPYATGKRVGDITIGDFWGIEKALPDFKKELGNSLAIISTERGERLFNSVKEQLEVRESELQRALQPSLKSPAKKPANYNEVISDFEKNGYEYISKKYSIVPLTQRVKRKIKKALNR